MTSNNSDANLYTATLTWTINGFSSLEALQRYKFSPNFYSPKNNKIIWSLVMKPNGKNDAKDTISLYLHLNSTSENSQTVFAIFNAHIITNSGGKTTSKSPQVHEYFEDPNNMSRTCWGWKDFCTKDENFRTNLLSNNELTICVEVVFSKILSVLIEGLNKTPLRSNADCCDLSENLASLLGNKEFSDIVFSTKENDLPAHKVILAARSKVFAAMFRHDMKENQLNRIEMEDMNEETVVEMLRFIYTGRCENLEEFAEELLLAADKYELNRLKIISGRALFGTISAENASYILILADTCNAEELKNDVLQFIVSKGSEVLCTAGWKNMLAKSELVDEVCQAFAHKLTFEQLETCSFNSLLS